MRKLILAFVACAPLAQQPSSTSSTPAEPPTILVSAPFDGVHVDLHAAHDGRYWARGAHYKMSFGPDGATYLPLFSSRAPRHYPVRFGLSRRPAVDAIMHESGCILAAPGFPIEEHWDLRANGAEQSFVLHEAPADGALVVEVQTDLPYAGDARHGHRWVVAEFGEVRYGEAFAVGADGGKIPLRSTWDGRALRIDIPRDSHYPLVVDPFVATIGIASNESFDNRNPAVAFDAVNQVWCVAMEERVSALDTDIKVRRFSSAGALLDTDYFEAGTAVAQDPAVASATGGSFPSRFEVVWQESNRDIIGRSVAPLATSPSTPHVIHPGSLGANPGKSPAVAGSTIGAILVVYVEDILAVNPVVTARRIGPTGTVSVPVQVGNLFGCVTPKVADMRPGLNHWPIAVTDQASTCVSGDIKIAVLNDSLGFEMPLTVVAGAILDDDRNADIAWNGSRGIITWDRDMGSHHDIFGQAFTRTASGYQMLGSIRNLTAIEPGVTVSGDQRRPVITSDGARFGLCYLEGANANPVCATFAIVNGAIVCHEGHVPVATAPIPHEEHDIAATGTSGGATTRYFVVTDERDGLNDYDVQGLFYDGRQPGAYFTSIATGCLPSGAGAVEPSLATTGEAELGSSFVVQMSGHVALPFLVAGAPQTPATTLCTYLVTRRCRQGVQSPFLTTLFGSSMSVTVPASAGLVGLELAFQGLDVLAPGACSASLFGSAFSVTDTIVATIR